MRTVKPPLENSATELPIEFSLIIPSTRDDDERISDGWFERRIKEEEKWWDKRFGGSTIELHEGQYVEGDHIIEEDVAELTVSMSKETYEEWRKMIGNRIRQKKQAWKQDTILYKINGHAFIYPDKEYIEGEDVKEVPI